MSFVIGTAGHIDHGKTSLVKALTGQDTDRLKEEQARGISIDIGFAYLDLPSGVRAAVVDVPGHERFIRNMLAGAHGIDLVLFTVAADDGVMPQTHEHFEIVRRLGVTVGVFAITKADLAGEHRLREVDDEIAALTAGTPFASAPRIPVSVVTGAGLEALVAQLDDRARDVPPRRSGGGFRLPVDRVFVAHGHGVVVTGTALDGEVRLGDRLRVLPGGDVYRVRAMHVHGAPVDSAAAGQRVALNLGGAEKAAITRGHVVCAESITRTTQRFDATFEVPASASEPVETHQRVRIHAGTAERLGTIIVLGEAGDVPPGGAALVQVVLTEPLLVLRGDRFIVRDHTAQRTLGGGMVVDPWAEKHRRSDASVVPAVRALAEGPLDVALQTVIGRHREWFAPFATLRDFANAPEGAVRAALDGSGASNPATEAGAAAGGGLVTLVVEGDTVHVSRERWEAVTGALVDAVQAFHAAQPLAPGAEMEPLRERLPGLVPPRVFRAVVDRVVADGRLVRDGSLLRHPSHALRVDAATDTLLRGILDRLRAAPFAPPDLKQLEQELKAPRPKLLETMRLLERQRAVVRVAMDLYFLPDAVERITRTLRERLGGGATITPAAFRDLFAISRKHAIPLLEYLDRAAVTVRVGDARRLRG